MRFTRFCAIILFLLLSVPLTAKNVNAREDSLWHQYYANPSKAAKVDILIKIARDVGWKGKDAERDSIYDIAVALSGVSDTLLFKTCKSYLEIDDLDGDKAISHANKMLQIARARQSNEYFFEAFRSFAAGEIITKNFEAASDHANKALHYATLLKNDILKAKAMLLLGNSENDDKNAKKIEAFRHYMDALYIAEKNNNDDLKEKAFDDLSTFYLLLKKYGKAKYYKVKEISLVVGKQGRDSAKIMKLNSELAQILFHNEDIEKAKFLCNKIIVFANSYGYEKLLNGEYGAFKSYRTYLIDNGLLNELRDLYEKDYPQEYGKLAKGDPSLYYRVNSYILEADGKPDSAQLFYQLAEKRYLGKKNKDIVLANFYKRYGEFLMRQGKVSAAIAKLDSAYKFALSEKYYPYLIDVTHYLDTLNYMQKNVDSAYAYGKLNKHYSDLQASVNKGEEMLQLEVENEARQQELKAEMDKAETERQDNIQYTFMVVAILGIFILLTILGSFKVHPSLIRAMGFFSFIFFFEFIIMLADHRIHDFTHGVPWKFMAFKIVLIAGLLPLHHWLEEKVIHYLVHHKLIDTSKFSFKRILSGKPKKVSVIVEDAPSDN